MNPGDTVWARVSRKGRFFPALVLDEKETDIGLRVRKGMVLARFFGTYEYSAISQNNCFDFKEHMSTYQRHMKSHNGRTALKEALVYARTGTIPDGFKDEEEEEEEEEEDDEEEEVSEEVKEESGKRPRSVTPEDPNLYRIPAPGDDDYEEWKSRKDKRVAVQQKLGLAPLPDSYLLNYGIEENMRKILIP